MEMPTGKGEWQITVGRHYLKKLVWYLPLNIDISQSSSRTLLSWAPPINLLHSLLFQVIYPFIYKHQVRHSIHDKYNKLEMDNQLVMSCPFNFQISPKPLSTYLSLNASVLVQATVAFIWIISLSMISYYLVHFPLFPRKTFSKGK